MKSINKRVLIIAYHFPPLQGSSGIQRTLNFAKYLPEYGWEPLVLTAHPRAYPKVSDDLLADIPENVKVYPSFAVDTAKHLSLAGRYSKYMALPDRWIGWSFGAVPLGLKLIKKYQPSIILSTFPIATAHLIGLGLHKITKIPWVADFRDSMTEDFYPPDRLVRSVYQNIEKKVVKNCARSVFTTPSTLEMYANRYPEVPQQKWVEISNGFDEENFSKVAHDFIENNTPSNILTFVHSGLLYQEERNPSAFFQALSELHQQGFVDGNKVRITLRASGNEDNYERDLIKYGIDKFVFLAPAIAYSDALAEMVQADVLLLFQGESCNHQIPAKVYEYVRAKRPILALTDKKGDTAKLLKGLGVKTVYDMNSKEEIIVGIKFLLEAVKSGAISPVPEEQIQLLSRRNQTKSLAAVFNDVCIS